MLGKLNTQVVRGKAVKNTARRKKLKINWSAWFLLLPGLILLYFMVWRPIFQGTWLSLFSLKGYTPVKFIGLDNYIRITSDTLFLKTLGNTCKYVGWSLLIGYLPPILVGILLSEIAHAKGFFKFSIYFPVIVPTIAASMMWYYMYLPGPSGLLNMLLNLFGIAPWGWLQNSAATIPLIVLTCTWQGFGSSALMYFAALQGINQELYEAVKIDGGGGRRRLFHIALPQIAPIMMLFLIRQMIITFQIMVHPMTMTAGGPNNASVSLSLQAYKYAFIDFQIGKALAMGVISFLILMCLTVLYFYLEKKLDKGASN